VARTDLSKGLVPGFDLTSQELEGLRLSIRRRLPQGSLVFSELSPRTMQRQLDASYLLRGLDLPADLRLADVPHYFLAAVCS